MNDPQQPEAKSKSDQAALQKEDDELFAHARRCVKCASIMRYEQLAGWVCPKECRQ